MLGSSCSQIALGSLGCLANGCHEPMEATLLNEWHELSKCPAWDDAKSKSYLFWWVCSGGSVAPSREIRPKNPWLQMAPPISLIFVAASYKHLWDTKVMRPSRKSAQYCDLLDQKIMWGISCLWWLHLSKSQELHQFYRRRPSLSQQKPSNIHLPIWVKTIKALTHPGPISFFCTMMSWFSKCFCMG